MKRFRVRWADVAAVIGSSVLLAWFLLYVVDNLPS